MRALGIEPAEGGYPHGPNPVSDLVYTNWSTETEGCYDGWTVVGPELVDQIAVVPDGYVSIHGLTQSLGADPIEVHRKTADIVHELTQAAEDGDDTTTPAHAIFSRENNRRTTVYFSPVVAALVTEALTTTDK
jgi:hypothetical protein